MNRKKVRWKNHMHTLNTTNTKHRMNEWTNQTPIQKFKWNPRKKLLRGSIDRQTDVDDTPDNIIQKKGLACKGGSLHSKCNSWSMMVCDTSHRLRLTMYRSKERETEKWRPRVVQQCKAIQSTFIGCLDRGKGPKPNQTGMNKKNEQPALVPFFFCFGCSIT